MKVKHFINTAIVFLSLGVIKSPFALAIFDIQGQVGTRTGTFTSTDTSATKTDIKATALRVGFHLDPIPLVPIAFGLGVEINDYDIKDVDLSGRALHPEILAWWPIGDFKPFIRLSYAINTMTGTYSITNGDVKSSVEITRIGRGLHTGLGFKFSLVPSLALLGEYTMGNEEITGGKILGTELPDTKSKTSAFLVGAEWGL